MCPPCRCAASPLRGELAFSISLTQKEKPEAQSPRMGAAAQPRGNIYRVVGGFRLSKKTKISARLPAVAGEFFAPSLAKKQRE